MKSRGLEKLIEQVINDFAIDFLNLVIKHCRAK